MPAKAPKVEDTDSGDMAMVVSPSSNPLPSKRSGSAYRPTPAKTFQCRGFGDCRMVFSRSEHLARHIRKHTGERPFTCHCSKQFSRLDNLRQHAQTVHADKTDENEAMMRDLTSLHASMVATHKSTRRRGTASSTKVRPGTATGYETQYVPQGAGPASGGKSPHSAYSPGSPSYDSSPIDLRSRHSFAGPPPSSAGASSAASPTRHEFLSSSSVGPNSSSNNSFQDASPSAQPNSFRAQQQDARFHQSTSASRSASNKSFLVPDATTNGSPKQSFRPNGSTNSSFRTQRSPQSAFRTHTPTSTTNSTTATTTNTSRESFRSPLSFRPSTTSGTEGASFGFRTPTQSVTEGRSPGSIDSNERSILTTPVSVHGGGRGFRVESPPEKASEPSGYGKTLPGADSFSSPDDGRRSRPSTAGASFFTQPKFPRDRREQQRDRQQGFEESAFRFSVPDSVPIPSTTLSNPSSRPHTSHTTTSTNSSTPTATASGPFSSSRPSTSSKLVFGSGQQQQLPPLSSIVSHSALTSRPPTASSRPGTASGGTGMVIDPTPSSGPASMDRISSSTAMVGSAAAAATASTTGGLARTTEFRVLPLPSGSGGSRPGTSGGQGGVIISGGGQGRLGTSDGSGQWNGGERGGDVWRRDVCMDGTRQRPSTGGSSHFRGRSGRFYNENHGQQQQCDNDGDVDMGEPEDESPFSFNVGSQQQQQQQRQQQQSQQNHISGGAGNPRKRTFADATAAEGGGNGRRRGDEYGGFYSYPDDERRPTSRRRSSCQRGGSMDDERGEWTANSRPTTSSGFGFSYLTLNSSASSSPSQQQQPYGGGAGKTTEVSTRTSPSAALAALVDASAAESRGYYVSSSKSNSNIDGSPPTAYQQQQQQRKTPSLSSSPRYGHGGLLVGGWGSGSPTTAATTATSSPPSAAAAVASAAARNGSLSPPTYASTGFTNSPTTTTTTIRSASPNSTATSPSSRMGTSGLRFLASAAAVAAAGGGGSGGGPKGGLVGPGWRGQDGGGIVRDDSASPAASSGASPSGAVESERVIGNTSGVARVGIRG